MKKRFVALRVISVIYKIMAVLTFLGALGVIALNLSQVSGGNAEMNDAMPLILGSVIGGIFGSLSLLAFAQLFDLLIALEENTRATSMLIQNLGKVMRDRL